MEAVEEIIEIPRIPTPVHPFCQSAGYVAAPLGPIDDEWSDQMFPLTSRKRSFTTFSHQPLEHVSIALPGTESTHPDGGDQTVHVPAKKRCFIWLEMGKLIQQDTTNFWRRCGEQQSW